MTGKIIDCDYAVVKKREPASDLPPWLEVTLRIAEKSILWIFAAYCLSFYVQDMMR